MYKKIMVPLDGSDLAECVLPHVEAIGQGCEVKNIVFVRVVEPSRYRLSGIGEHSFSEDELNKMDAENQADAQSYLNDLFGRLKLGEARLHTDVIVGERAAESLADYATKIDADLIVIATHGRAGISRWVWGSVADRILRSACVPVLMVRAPGCVPGIQAHVTWQAKYRQITNSITVEYGEITYIYERSDKQVKRVLPENRTGRRCGKVTVVNDGKAEVMGCPDRQQARLFKWYNDLRIKVVCDVNCIRWGAQNLFYEEVKGKRVVEVGSYDVNGSLRYIVELLQPEEYVGTDVADGPGVDIVCPAENLVEKFGEESFDIVISTCLLEHMRDWKRAVSNIKNVCRANGIIMIIVPSVMPYHSHPHDFWRFSKEDMANIFRDCEMLALEEDYQPLSNVYCKVKKPGEFLEEDLSEYALYSIVVKKRIIEIEDSHLQGFRFKFLLFGQKVRHIKKKADSFLLKWFMRCFNASPEQ